MSDAYRGRGRRSRFRRNGAPEGAKPRSQIIGQIKQSDDLRYIDEVELKRGQYYVEYYAKERVEYKIYVDLATGKTR